MYRHEWHQHRHDAHSGPVGGAILVTLGVAFMLRQTFQIDLAGLAWPLFIVVPGLGLFGAALLGGRGAGHLAIPGSVVTTLGLLLLFQSAFDYYESWAYVWALLPVATGVGMTIAGLREGQPKETRVGVEMIGGGLTAFLAFGAFFELFIFHGTFLGAYTWPLALIAVGALLLVRGRLGRRPAGDPRYDLDQAEPQPHADGPVFPY
jgi:hypothetical protein